MASTAIAAGLALAAVGLTGRYIVRALPSMTTKMQEALKNLPNFNGDSLSNSRYYKGGFEPKMTKREASLILGISPTAPKTKVKDAFKKVMSQNHPDRGGSPYIASKINEAKDLMESGKQQH